MISIFNGRRRSLGQGGKPNVFVQVDVGLRDYLHLFKGAKLAVLLAIALHANEDGWAWPSYETLMRETGYSPATLKKALDELCKVEIEGQRILLRYQPQGEGGKFESNRYLLFPSPEEVARYEGQGVTHLGAGTGGGFDRGIKTIPRSPWYNFSATEKLYHEQEPLLEPEPCLNNNNNNNNNPPLYPPPRRPGDLPMQTLRVQFPTQPDGMDPDDAFNLALDRALALLPARLRREADDALYALAVEAHPAAVLNPSAAWPDAGGAGWVVDAVVDLLAGGGKIESIEPIRATVRRWLQEGSPYATSAPTEVEPDNLAGWEEAVRSTWEAATGKAISPDEVAALMALLGPGEGQTNLAGLLSTIVAVGLRLDEPTVEAVAAVVEGRLALPPVDLGPEVGEPGEVKVSTLPAETGRDELDPVMARVVELYEQEVGFPITPLTADEIRDLTAEHRDVAAWEAAFRKAVGTEGLGKWRYVKQVIAGGSDGRKRRRAAAGDGARQRGSEGRAATRTTRSRRGRNRVYTDADLERLLREYGDEE